MTRIGLISDTHGFLDEAVFRHFREVDEIWHGGDFGSLELLEALAAFKPLRGVYGNIDEPAIRQRMPETLQFSCEGLAVSMIHIGGYPGKYSPAGRKLIRSSQPNLLIAGHSHLLKIQYDEQYQCLFINPGAAGRQGWHQIRTLVMLTIDGKAMRDCKVVELGPRSSLG